MNCVAAIDCGTNTIRLMIARPRPAESPAAERDGGLEILENRMRVVRLGQGVDATGAFAPAALERTLAAIAEYADVLAQYPINSLRFAATSATRDASNRQVLLDAVRDSLGCEVEVLSGQEEARTSFLGATRALVGIPEPALVVDIGGGSTEFVLGHGEKLLGALSTDMGSVRLYERYFAPVFARALETGELAPEQRGSLDPTRFPVTGLRRALEEATAEVDRLIGEAEKKVDFSLVGSLVGVAGTVTTVRARALNLPAYQPERIHASALTPQAESLACFQLMNMTVPEREALPYMAPGRADVIGTGALIWWRIIERVNGVFSGRGDELKRVVVSESDILNGLIYSQLTSL